jgi:hypothetical protein
MWTSSGRVRREVERGAVSGPYQDLPKLFCGKAPFARTPYFMQVFLRFSLVTFSDPSSPLVTLWERVGGGVEWSDVPKSLDFAE